MNTPLQDLIIWMKITRTAFEREQNKGAIHALNLAIVEAECNLDSEHKMVVDAWENGEGSTHYLESGKQYFETNFSKI